MDCGGVVRRPPRRRRTAQRALSEGSAPKDERKAEVCDAVAEAPMEGSEESAGALPVLAVSPPAAAAADATAEDCVLACIVGGLTEDEEAVFRLWTTSLAGPEVDLPVLSTYTVSCIAVMLAGSSYGERCEERSVKSG